MIKRALSEEQMDILADKYIMSLYTDLEDEVIADIARRVQKTGRYTETAELMAKSMHEQGYSPAKIQSEVMKKIRADKALQMEIAENTKAYKAAIQKIITETVESAKKAGNKLIAEAGNMAWNNDLSMWQEHGTDLQKPNTMNQMITAFRLQTSEQLRNLTQTMGFKNTTLGTTEILNAYQREMDLALLKVSTGTFSYDQAVNDCVRRLAQSGLRSINYESGRTYQLDTAARMCVRTGMSQLAGRIMEANLASTGHDLVITSQHMGSRPEHAPWQNKVFSYSGKNEKYPDFVKGTRYGKVDGLKGANCTHDFYPFWEGASVIPEDIKEPEPVEVNGREYTYYQATQKQRHMERNIRATKREIEAQNAIGGDTTDLRAKLKQQTAEYKSFSSAAGLKEKNNRLRVVGGSSDLRKTHASEKQLKVFESRAAENKAKSLFDVQSLAKGDTVKPISIYKDLKTSEIGLHVLEYIEKNSVSVEIFYDKDTIAAYQMEDNYGMCMGNHIYINARTCNTKKKMVETIIHEETHIEYNIGGDMHAECVCDYYALKHRKGKLTGDDIRSIIISVKERYSNLGWRKR